MMKCINVLAWVTIGLLLNACSDSEPATKTSTQTPVSAPQQVKTASAVDVAANKQSNPDWPTYLVGSELNYEPFEFKDEKGLPTGFEIELLQAIGQASKFNVTFIHASRNEVLDTLNKGQFIIWASALSVSPERTAQMDFSEPHLDFVRAIYVLDKPENRALQTAQDFKGKKIAVNKGSRSAIEAAKELTGNDDAVVQADTYYLSLNEMYKGNAVGTLGDSRILQYYQTKHADIQTRLIPLDEQRKNIAFAVKKGNTHVLNQINEGFATIKADGTYDKLVAKWFGSTE